MRPNEAGMLTKIRSLFLIRSAARWRKALRDAACPRTGRLASKHRAPPAISWCGFTGRRGARHLLGAIAAPHPHIPRWDHSPILAYAWIAVAFQHGPWMLAIRALGFSDRRRAEKQR